jgi:hypothetical protein
MSNIITIDFSSRGSRSNVNPAQDYLNQYQALMLTAMGQVVDDATLVEFAAALADVECYQQSTDTIRVLVDIFRVMGKE